MALALALLLAWAHPARADEAAAPAPASPHILVTTATALDARRLADVLRAYLGDVGVRVEPAQAGTTGSLRQQLDDARRLGRAAGATTVVRVERDASDGNPGGLDIEVIDLTTDDVVIATVASPARDEDRYRALALKLQAILQARWSAGHPGTRAEEGASLDRGDADVATVRSISGVASRVALDVGLALVSFPIAGPVLDGLDVRAWWLPSPRIALALGAALLASTSASNGDVDAVATMLPIRAAAMFRLARGRAALFAGPTAELSLVRVAASSTTTPVRSVRHVMIAVGAEVDARLALAGPLWLFTRAAALGVLNGEHYDAAGVPLIDTSRFELTGTVGLALAIP